MTTIDLIELAVLDALGMLDRDERDAFERAFQAASAATQARVRQEQERLADLEHLLPDATPSPELRDAVIRAVREAVLGESIARAAEQDRHTPATTLRHDDHDLYTAVAAAIQPSWGVSRVWRFAAFGSAAAAILFGVAFGTMWQRYTELDARIQNNAHVGRFAEAFGPELVESLTNPDSYRTVRFTPTDPDADVAVALWLYEDDLALLNCARLPADDRTTYALVVLEDNGQLGRTIHQFEGGGPLTTHRIENIDLKPGVRLAVAKIDRRTGARSILLQTGPIQA